MVSYNIVHTTYVFLVVSPQPALSVFVRVHHVLPSIYEVALFSVMMSDLVAFHVLSTLKHRRQNRQQSRSSSCSQNLTCHHH